MRAAVYRGPGVVEWSSWPDPTAGAGVTGFEVGDRLVAAHHIPCLTCHYCRRGSPSMCRSFKEGNLDPGGFAEFLRVPAANVRHAAFRVPKSLSDETASFTEPLACCLRAVNRSRSHASGAGTQPGDYTEPEPLAEAISEATAGRGADLAFITAGGAGVLASLAPLVRDGGALGEAFELLVRGEVQVEPLVTHRLPLSQLGEAVKLAVSRQTLKIFLLGGTA